MDLRHLLFEVVRVNEPAERRRIFFEKLLRLAGKHGELVERIIAVAWAHASTHANKAPADHLFCRTVKIKLQKAGVWDEADEFEGMTLEEIYKLPAFKDVLPMPLFVDAIKQNPLARPGHHPRCIRPTCAGCS